MAQIPKQNRPLLSLIVARAENGVIGRDNDMPWSLSADLKRFRALTSGRPIIMGRNTWDSLPRKPLPKRPNIVVSRNPDLKVDGAWLASSLESAISVGEAMATEAGTSDFFIIGGARLYEDALPFAKRLHLTEVEATIEGDTFFPEFDETEWKEVSSESLPADEENTFPTRYRLLERIS